MENVERVKKTRKSTKRKSYKKLNEAEFKSLKLLTDAGIKRSVVCRATGRSNDTIRRIESAKNFTDYRAITQAQLDKYTSPVPEPGEVLPLENVVVASTPQPSELTRIADALERLANAWEAAPNKRRLF